MLSTEQNDIKNTLVTKASAAAVKQHGRSDFSKELIDYNIDIGDEKAVLRGFSDADSFKIIDSVACELISQRDLFSVFVFLTSMHDLIEALYKSYNDNKMSPQPPSQQPNIQPSSLDALVGIPFAYDTGSRILCNVMFGDPFKQFETVEAARSWLTSFMSTVKPVDSNIRNFTTSRQWKDLRYEDDPDEVFRVFGWGGIMLQSPNIWSGPTSRSFNSIVTGWNITDGKGGSLLPIMNLTGKGIDVPVLNVASDQIISTPRWDIVGSNAVTALGAPANLQNLAIVPQSRYSEFTATNTTTAETHENMFLKPGDTVESIYKAFGGFPASIHMHNGKIFALLVIDEEYTIGVMLDASYILEGNVFVDKYNATIRKLTHEGHTYDIIKVDTNHWRLEPENVEFTELAAITLQNEIPTLQNPVVWRKHPDTGVWQEVHAQFNAAGEFTIANTSATHFSDWAINRSDIVFRVNGADVLEADGIRDYPSDPLQYSVTVNDPSTAVVEVFEKQLNTDDYIVEYGQLIDDEDDPGSKRMSISYGFNQHKYDQYRANTEAPLRDIVYNCSLRSSYLSAYDNKLAENPFTLLGDYADRVANNYRSTTNLIAYMQFLQYFVENRMNVNEKTLKYIYDEVMQPYFVDYVQENIDNGLNDASVSLTSSYNIINNIGTILDDIVNVTCDSQPTEPTPAKRESIRNEAVEYYTLLYPIRQIVHDKYVVIKDIFNEAKRLSYSSNPVETTRLAPYFQQNPGLLMNILAALKEIILVTAEFVDTIVDKYMPIQTKNDYYGHLTSAGYASMYEAIDNFLRSGAVNNDFATDTFESFAAAADGATILDANPFFSIERIYEEARLASSSRRRGSILKIKAATRHPILQAAMTAQLEASHALEEAYAVLGRAEETTRTAVGLRAQLNYNPGGGAGDTNYTTAAAAETVARADYNVAVTAEADAVEALGLISHAYQWLSPTDIGVSSTALITITELVDTAEETWGRLQIISDVSRDSYATSQQATIEAKRINPTDAEAAIISSASEAVTAAKATSDVALDRKNATITAVVEAQAIWGQSKTEESRVALDTAATISAQACFIWEQAFNVFREAEIARDAAIHNTAGGRAVQHATSIEAAALSHYELASWNTISSKKLYDTALLRQQYATLFAAV
jgi:hypothetical protein